MLLANGFYEAEIVNVVQMSSKAGNLMIRIEYLVEVDHTLFQYFVLQGKSLYFFRRFLDSIRVPYTSQGFEANDLIGLRVKVYVKQENIPNSRRLYNHILAATALENTLPEEINDMTTLDVLKLLYPKQNVDALLKVLEG